MGRGMLHREDDGGLLPPISLGTRTSSYLGPLTLPWLQQFRSRRLRLKLTVLLPGPESVPSRTIPRGRLGQEEWMCPGLKAGAFRREGTHQVSSSIHTTSLAPEIVALARCGQRAASNRLEERETLATQCHYTARSTANTCASVDPFDERLAAQRT